MPRQRVREIREEAGPRESGNGAQATDGYKPRLKVQYEQELRGRLKEDGPPPQISLSAIYPNAVFALQQQRFTDVPLGKATGRPSEIFRIIQAPVIPVELEKEISVLDVPLPGFRDLVQLLKEIVAVVRQGNKARVELSKDEAEQLITGASSAPPPEDPPATATNGTN